MTTANDVIFYLQRASRMSADLQLPATDEQIETHLATAIIEGTAPTLAEFRAGETAYAQQIEASRIANKVAQMTAALDAHIDSVAKAKGYDSRITCTMRAGFASPWQSECIAFAQWMDTCYLSAQVILNEATAGTRPVPTESELIAALPAMVWP